MKEFNEVGEATQFARTMSALANDKRFVYFEATNQKWVVAHTPTDQPDIMCFQNGKSVGLIDGKSIVERKKKAEERAQKRKEKKERHGMRLVDKLISEIFSPAPTEPEKAPLPESQPPESGL